MSQSHVKQRGSFEQDIRRVQTGSRLSMLRLPALKLSPPKPTNICKFKTAGSDNAGQNRQIWKRMKYENGCITRSRNMKAVGMGVRAVSDGKPCQTS